MAQTNEIKIKNRKFRNEFKMKMQGREEVIQLSLGQQEN